MFDGSKNDNIYVFSEGTDNQGNTVSKILSPAIFSDEDTPVIDAQLVPQGNGNYRQIIVVFTDVADIPEITEVGFQINLPEGTSPAVVNRVILETDTEGPFEVIFKFRMYIVCCLEKNGNKGIHLQT